MNPFYPDDKQDEARLIAFAQGCSGLSLDSLFLKRLEFDQQLRKQIAALIDQAVSNLLIVRWAQFLRDHPELRAPQTVEASNGHGDATPAKSLRSPRRTPQV